MYNADTGKAQTYVKIKNNNYASRVPLRRPQSVRTAGSTLCVVIGHTVCEVLGHIYIHITHGEADY